MLYLLQNEEQTSLMLKAVFGLQYLAGAQAKEQLEYPSEPASGVALAQAELTVATMVPAGSAGQVTLSVQQVEVHLGTSDANINEERIISRNSISVLPVDMSSAASPQSYNSDQWPKCLEQILLRSPKFESV